MYFIVLFVLAWTWFYFRANKKRAREIYGAAIFASLLGLMTDLIMVHYNLWSYSGLPQPLYTIPLLLEFSVYPVVSYLFVQKLPPTWKDIFKRILIWTLFAGLLEWITLETGYMQHKLWWNLWLSVVADVMIFFLITGIYRFYSPAYVSKTNI
ncbi:MAG: hypothetical protein FH756_19745 [Firmicutes bacterium]|nr:hypothetical protein [Bacillota bacterium]